MPRQTRTIPGRMSELHLDDLLTVEQAVARIDAVPVAPRKGWASLLDADGLVLADDIAADRDYPPFDRSAVDGFAVRGEDLARAPVELSVVGEVRAGQMPSRGISVGQAMRIMTGAPLPDGADNCVPVEQTQTVGSRVRVMVAGAPGRLVSKRGSDCRAGEFVLRRGEIVTPASIAVLATVGVTRVPVFLRPRAAVLSTGDELTRGEGNSAIRDANRPMLLALLRQLGCDVTDLGAFPDDPDAIREAMQRGLNYDLLVTSGGISMGDADHVPAIARQLGVALHVSKLRIKPGKPFLYGTAGACHFVGLPGNPVSAFCCTHRLASRTVARLRGATLREPWRDAILEDDLPANGPREFYMPAVLEEGRVRALHWKGSADVFTLARANALLARAADDPPRRAGEQVRAWELR